MSTCPNCGGTKVEFRRERTGSTSSSNGASVKLTKNIRAGSGKRKSSYNYRTIGFCKECGHTFTVETHNNNHSILFWIIAIIFFPISLSVLFWKTDKFNLPKKTKSIVLIVIWLLLIIISSVGKQSTVKPESSIENSVEIETSDSTTKEFESVSESDTIIESESIADSESIAESESISELSKESVAESNSTANSIIVNATNGKVHCSSCWKLPDEDNRIYFNSLEDAQNNGYTDLCGMCMN